MALKSKALVVLLALAQVQAQVSFGGGGSSNPGVDNRNGNVKNDEVGERGLLADLLGKHPLGNKGDGNSNNNNGGNAGGRGNFCCCASTNVCPNGGNSNNNNEPDFGLNPRDGPASQNAGQQDDIVTRIVNNPLSEPQQGCFPNERVCCYNRQRIVNRLERRGLCRNPNNQAALPWRQGCPTRAPRSLSGQRCGERRFSHIGGLKRGEASPSEFPWTCLVLFANNSFVGTCAVVAENFGNDIGAGTRKVITAAHKLDVLVGSDEIKVRVGEYNAQGFFKPPEPEVHQEYVVTRITYYPQYDKQSRRFDKNMAVLTLNKRINLINNNLNINAACLPQCGNMFSGHQYNNGTGVRCWVAGWGKNRFNGEFQPIMHKVDVPLVQDNTCQRLLQDAIGRDKGANIGRQFRLHESEICAGGEAGKDACEGDGGAPLVCQSQDGLWHVVGLVTWGVDCAIQNVPGVYADVFYFRNFIENS